MSATSTWIWWWIWFPSCLCQNSVSAWRCCSSSVFQWLHLCRSAWELSSTVCSAGSYNSSHCPGRGWTVSLSPSLDVRQSLPWCQPRQGCTPHTSAESGSHLGPGQWSVVSGHLRLVKVGQFIFTSLPDCMARDSKSRVISTKASFTLIKLVNAAGLPGCLSGWLLYDFFLKATLTSLRREELICDGALQSYLILEEGDIPRIL